MRKFMSRFFFNGSSTAKVDEKHRFVLPQSMRFGLIEDGKLEFTIAIGMGGCLTIYRRSEIEKIVEKFRAKQHNVKLQKFFTLFFSTLHHTTCDKIGRVSLPSILMRATGISDEIVVAGVLNKIEIWPRQKYEENLKAFLDDSEGETDLGKLAEEAFAMIDDSLPPTSPDVSLSDQREFENL